MFKLELFPKFIRKLNKLVKKDRSLEKKVNKSLSLLKLDPFNTILKTHSVIEVDGDKAFSSRVTGDLRIIWNLIRIIPKH